MEAQPRHAGLPGKKQQPGDSDVKTGVCNNIGLLEVRTSN
jgi:hypothetical protein